MSLVKIDWKPDSAALRKFGVSLVVGFCVLGLAFWLVPYFPFRNNRFAAQICFTLGVVLGGIGLSGSRVALPIYYLWMGLAFVLGNVMTRVIFSIVYFCLFTPMGLVMRLTGRDKLALRKPAAASYWSDLAPPAEAPERHERQF